MKANYVQIGTVTVTSDEAEECFRLARQFNTNAESVALLRANRNNPEVKGGMVAALHGAQAHEVVRVRKSLGLGSFLGFIVCALAVTAALCYIGQGFTVVHLLGF